MSEFRRKLIMVSRGGGGSIGYYTIDQTGTYSDPAQMVRDRDVSGIQAIRDASHLYVGELIDGVLVCKQVSDSDKTLYADGTSVVLDGNKDLFMKLPQFWWMAENIDNNADKVKFSFSMAQKNGWHEWVGNVFIGVYKGYVSSNKMYSRSGVMPTANINKPNAKLYARNRGNGYQSISYEAHCIMALLGFGYLGTVDAKPIVGYCVQAYPQTTGTNDNLGMRDTVYDGSDIQINFWGIEDWWGNLCEIVDNVDCNSGMLNVRDYDGNVVRQVPVSALNSDRGVSKIKLGEWGDVFPTAQTNNYTTYYCNYGRIWSTSAKQFRRGNQNKSFSGLTFCQIYSTETATGQNIGCRLQYTGNYEIIV